MLIIKNADVYSIDLEGTETHAEALAVDGEKIVYVGTNEGVEEYEIDGAEIIDAKGNTVLPGMCDAHVHSSWGSSAKDVCTCFIWPITARTGESSRRYRRSLPNT